MNPTLISLLIVLTTAIKALSPSDWRPVGQGDPLIDPTHVYSPPMVENVHYWLEPRHQPRVELASVTHKGIPLGFSQVNQHYQKYSPHRQLVDTSSYPKNTILEHYTGSNTQQNYGFPPRKNPSFISENYPFNQDSLNSFTHIEPLVTPITTEHSLYNDEKQIFLEMTSTMPSTISLEPQILSLSLKPPPEHAVTVGQIAGWPQISTHLQPTNLFTENNQRITTAYYRGPSQVLNHVTTPKQIPSHLLVTSSTTTTTTTAKPPPTSQPVSLVIEGHSKVKKYGPLPESPSKSVKVLNHNHLINKNACKDCIDLPIAKVKQATSGDD